MKKVGWRNKFISLSKPNIEFTYSGSGLSGFNNGVYFRSTIWFNSTNYDYLNFFIDAESRELNKNYDIETISLKKELPVYGNEYEILLVFLKYDDAYPGELLLNWTPVYENFLNDYLAKKQEVPNPVQYKIHPVVIEVPEGVHRPVPSNSIFNTEERGLIYQAAISELGESNFDLITVAPILINGFGGYVGTYNNMPFIHASLIPEEAYLEGDLDNKIKSVLAFQNLFGVISHEILHTLGLAGDHMTMGYGTLYLDYVGQDVDLLTGYLRDYPNKCDFYGESNDYYFAELPLNLRIFVGDEPEFFDGNPSYLRTEESDSGKCLYGSSSDLVLKDINLDGIYEISYKNNLIGKELQQSLGWIDIDGDGITELVDDNPYQINNIEIYDIRDHLPSQDEEGPYGFEVVSPEVYIDNCKFAKILLDNDEEGYLPLKCLEFNEFISNVYNNVKYFWMNVEEDYGLVLIPTLK